MTDNIIEVTGLKNYLGGHWVHNGVDLTVKRGEIVAIIGGSGCGKTVFLRTLMMLQKPTMGMVKVFGKNITKCTAKEAMEIQKRWGVLFQNSALFSSLTVLENVMFPMEQHHRLPATLQREAALLKITLAGLTIDAAPKYPAELSGGMAKRAALARAIALDPELLFLDEPTSGLDPSSSHDLDQLVLQLRKSLGLTFVMTTHDLDSLWCVPDRVVFIGEGKVLAALPIDQMVKQTHPLIQSYFSRRENNGYKS